MPRAPFIHVCRIYSGPDSAGGFATIGDFPCRVVPQNQIVSQSTQPPRTAWLTLDEYDPVEPWASGVYLPRIGDYVEYPILGTGPNYQIWYVDTITPEVGDRYYRIALTTNDSFPQVAPGCAWCSGGVPLLVPYRFDFPSEGLIDGRSGVVVYDPQPGYDCHWTETYVHGGNTFVVHLFDEPLAPGKSLSIEVNGDPLYYIGGEAGGLPPSHDVCPFGVTMEMYVYVAGPGTNGTAYFGADA